MMEILRTAKDLQSKVKQAQEGMSKEVFSVEHDFFNLTISGDETIQALSFTETAGSVELSQIADALVEQINKIKADIKNQNKEKMSAITKGILPGDFGDDA